MIRQQRALDEGRKLPYKIVLSVQGGAMAGIWGGGILEALAEKAPDAPDVCAGNSIGAVLQYAFMSGKSRLARPIFASIAWNDIIRGRFWSLEVRIEHVMKVLRAIGVDKMYKHRAEFIVYATEFSTGNSIVLDVKKAEDPIEAVQASMMVPGICSGVVRINGKEVVDGVCGMPFPIRHLVKTYRPTDILIVFNRPLPERMNWLEWHLFPWLVRVYFMLRGMPKSLRERTAMLDRVMADEIQLLTRRKATRWWDFFRGLILPAGRPLPRERKKLRWCIVAPEPHEAISYGCMERDEIRESGKQAYTLMRELLIKAGETIR